MLQDEGDDQLTRALGLNACYNYYLQATEEDYKNDAADEDDEDIVRKEEKRRDEMRRKRVLGQS